MRAYSLFALPADRKITPQRSADCRYRSRSTTAAWAPDSSWPPTISISVVPATSCRRGAVRPHQGGSRVPSSISRCRRRQSQVSRRGSASLLPNVPHTTIRAPVMIPEEYVADLPVRLALYRRFLVAHRRRDQVPSSLIVLAQCLGGAPAPGGAHQHALPRGQCGEDRRRSEGRG